MKDHIVMLLSNGFRPDPRVLREATSLSKAGYHLTVICWDRQAEFQASEKTEFGDLIRIQEVKTRYGAGERQLFKIPYFWKSAITKAIQAKPDMIHCHDLDTLYPGWRIKQRLNCPLIFDAHENYPALMSLYLPKVMGPAGTRARTLPGRTEAADPDARGRPEPEPVEFGRASSMKHGASWAGAESRRPWRPASLAAQQRRPGVTPTASRTTSPLAP